MMKNEPITKVFKLTRKQLEAHIRRVSQNTINVFFTSHIKRRMRERKITKVSVLDTLRNGRINRPPEPNHIKGSLECTMEHYCGGQNIGVVVAVSDDDPTLILVTAMRIQEK